MLIAGALILAFIVLHFIVYLFTNKQEKEDGAVLGRIMISLLMLAVIGGIGLVVFLIFKGVGYTFQHVIVFEDNTSIFIAAISMVLVLFLLSITVHPYLMHRYKILAKKTNNKGVSLSFYYVLRIAVDSLAMYILLTSLPGIKIENAYIAIFLATLLIIPDLFTSFKKDNTYNKDEKG